MRAWMRRHAVVLTAAAFAAAELCAFTARAEAASPWARETATAPAGSAYADLYDVSCVHATACVAVGLSHSTADRDVMLAERRDGTRWTVQNAHVPARSTDTRFSGTTCMSVSRCIAVGSYDTKGGLTLPLIEVWSGRDWTIQRSRVPVFGGEREDSALYAVSCTSATQCTAVGSRVDSSQPLVERWKAWRWSIQPTPKLAGDGGQLFDVSCTNRHMCTAVGQYDNSGCVAPLVERWNGDVWSIEQSPLPAGCGDDNVALESISCPSASRCTAVGEFEPDTGFGQPLVERWNGATWAFQPTPDISHLTDPWGSGGWLSGVSCSVLGSCTAVGAASSEIITRPLVEQWNGSRWAIERTPPHPLQGVLNGVSCTSTSTCRAVGADTTRGQYTDKPLVESRPAR
jgi:hypothetical protein